MMRNLSAISRAGVQNAPQLLCLQWSPTVADPGVLDMTSHSFAIAAIMGYHCSCYIVAKVCFKGVFRRAKHRKLRGRISSVGNKTLIRLLLGQRASITAQLHVGPLANWPGRSANGRYTATSIANREHVVLPRPPVRIVGLFSSAVA
jgi:hypothetical protein